MDPLTDTSPDFFGPKTSIFNKLNFSRCFSFCWHSGKVFPTADFFWKATKTADCWWQTCVERNLNRIIEAPHQPAHSFCPTVRNPGRQRSTALFVGVSHADVILTFREWLIASVPSRRTSHLSWRFVVMVKLSSFSTSAGGSSCQSYSAVGAPCLF